MILTKHILLFTLPIALLFFLGGINEETRPFVTKLEKECLILNSSFEEGEPGIFNLPTHWINCGSKVESPTDLYENGMKTLFGVDLLAQEGTKFVGMVVRSNNTRECIQQNFSETLQAGRYRIETTLAKSQTFSSSDRITNQMSDYTQAVILEIIGVNQDGEEILLHFTDPVDSSSWVTYTQDIEIPRSITAIKLSPNFENVFVKPYNGNILIDNFLLFKLR